MKLYGDKGLLYQWDLNQKVIVDKRVDRVDYCINAGEVLTVEPSVVDGLPVADIPNILLQESGSLTVYVRYNNQYGEYTYASSVLCVLPRPKPADYIYTETEVMTWKNVSEAALNMIRTMDATAEEGEEATATVSTEDDNIRLHFVIPRGEKYTLTEDDRNGIVEAVLAALPMAEGEVF